MIPQSQISLLICLLLIVLMIPLSSVKAYVSQGVGPIARPGCNDTCGDVSIPFPFGIGVGCFLDPSFEIECNASSKPILSKFGIEVMGVDIGSQSYASGSLVVRMPPLNMCIDATHAQHGIDLRGSPYNFSIDQNYFKLEGCAGSAVLVNQSNSIMAGCGTVCRDRSETAVTTNKCYGVECCQTPLSSDPYDRFSPLQFFHIKLDQVSIKSCLMATLIKSDSVNQYVGRMLTTNSTTVPVVLLWSWISNSRPDHNTKSLCYPSEGINYIAICECEQNYYGNPYVLDGCQLPQHCKGCHGYCFYDQTSNSYFCEATPRFTLSSILVYVVTLLVIAIVSWLYHFIKRRRKTERRVKFFKLKLQQHQLSNEGFVERTKLFTRKQLDKATDHFNENRILGRGGQGIVYKGMLIDGKIVAIKKPSKLTDESQMEQFINEVVILSTINHRNVVKLLGCCLETQVPLLVYEFISNGTLSQHIHNPSDDFVLSWAMRLKIAADSAGAVAYLHTSSSTPVYHRDIKPCNILLDDKHRAKVSDFGSSKTIEIDQTHLTTLVQGTFGYLDPEYFESGIFTDKSDVYSFGVVLLELLTSKKPVYRTETMEQKVLVTEFFLHIQNSSLLDPELMKEGKEEELIVVSHLARRCLNGSGRLRPTMKEVAMTLEMIINSPDEMSTHDQQTSHNEGFSEISRAEMSEVEFMSSTIPTSATSPLYIDAQPLLRDTI